MTSAVQGSIQINVQFRSRYLESAGISVGIKIGEYLGPGVSGSIPNRPMMITESRPITLGTFGSTESMIFDASTGEIGQGSFKVWIFLWNHLPSEPGFWESYAPKVEQTDIQIS